MQSHQDKRRRRRCEACSGIEGNQVINRRTARQGHSSNRVKDSRINSLGKGNGGKGKSGEGGGKKGKSEDAGALVWNQQTGSAVASLVASSAPQTETSATLGTIDTIECTALDLCATSMAQQEAANPCWIAVNVDTGGTVWPMNADNECEKVSGPAGRNLQDGDR